MTYELVAAAEAARHRRDAQRENAARHATCFLRHVTTGAGSIRTGVLMFDVVFLEQPSLVTGVVLEKPPDPLHYRMPSVTAGVHRWETIPHPGAPRFDAPPAVGASREATAEAQAAATGESPKLYVGAHVYFNVDIFPLLQPRTDGSNLADLQARLAKTAPNTVERANMEKLVAEAQEAVWLKANPASKTRIIHHLQFQGLALKGSLAVSDEMPSELPTRMPNVG